MSQEPGQTFGFGLRRQDAAEILAEGRLSGLPPRRLAPRPHSGSAARRVALLSPSSRFRHPRPLCRYGSPAVGTVPPLSVRVSGQLRPWPRFRRLSGAFRPLLGASALCRVPRERPVVAGCPGRPCPILRRLRPASPPRAPAVSGVVRPPAVRAHHADGPVRAPAPRRACHGCRQRPVPVEDSASLACPAPGQGPCHGSRGQSAGESGWPYGPSKSFFPGPNFG